MRRFSYVSAVDGLWTGRRITAKKRWISCVRRRLSADFPALRRCASVCVGSIGTKAALRVFGTFRRNALKDTDVGAAVGVGCDGQNAAGLAVRDGQLQITEVHFIRKDAGFLDFLVQPQVVFAQRFFFGAVEADYGNAFARAFDGIVSRPSNSSAYSARISDAAFSSVEANGGIRERIASVSRAVNACMKAS